MISHEQQTHFVECSDTGIITLAERHAGRIVELIQQGLGDWAKLSIYSSEGIDLHFRQLLRESPGNDYHYFGYFQDGSLIGYIEWRTIEGSQWFLNNMDVAAQAQGMGIGRKLVAHGLQLAQERGMAGSMLDVYRSNAKVLSWYETFGYRSQSQTYIYEFTPPDAVGTAIYGIDNLQEAIETYEERGYAMLELSGAQHHRVGLPNANYFVVRKLAEVADGALISAVLQAFPGRHGLLVSKCELSSSKLKLLEISVRMEMVL